MTSGNVAPEQRRNDTRGQIFATLRDLQNAVRDAARLEWNEKKENEPPRPEWSDAIADALRPLPNSPGLLLLKRERKARATLDTVEEIAKAALEAIRLS